MKSIAGGTDMRKLLIAMVALFMVAETAQAGSRLFITGGGTVVRVKDANKIAPFVVQQQVVFPQNVLVQDQFGRFFVQQRVSNFPVFLPAGVPRSIRYRRNSVKYDYGRFEVEIKRRRDGSIEIDYDD